jgi:hypothetical protein
MRAEVSTVIPTRDGSKGFPRRNFVSLRGKTICRVLVYAADSEISDGPFAAGPEFPYLPPDDLAGDRFEIKI